MHWFSCVFSSFVPASKSSPYLEFRAREPRYSGEPDKEQKFQPSTALNRSPLLIFDSLREVTYVKRQSRRVQRRDPRLSKCPGSRAITQNDDVHLRRPFPAPFENETS